MAHAVETPIAIGELIDKITILDIKLAQFSDPAKIRNAAAEHALLCARRDATIPASAMLDALTRQLKDANQRIWDLEDAIREHERQADFGAEFIAVARTIYRTNDERAGLKRQINIALGSDIIEEKSYRAY